MLSYILIFLMAIILTIVVIEVNNKKWQKKPLKNFPFTYRGREFWYSRAVAVVNFVFAQNSNKEWCVLANQRGRGTPDHQNLWNCPCGYLDFDETGEEAAQRETFEETSVFTKLDEINFVDVNTSPSENRQNVSLRYLTVLKTCCDDIETNASNAEKNEVKNIKWIPITEISNYEWAFDHDNLINQIFNKYFT